MLLQVRLGQSNIKHTIGVTQSAEDPSLVRFTMHRQLLRDGATPLGDERRRWRTRNLSALWKRMHHVGATTQPGIYVHHGVAPFGAPGTIIAL